jgi:hypothetical protein
MTPSAVRSVPAETKAAKYSNPAWKAPRTPWGDPDLQGEYSSDDMRGVPLSRPPAQASRESLTPEEFLQRASGDEANKFSSVNTETFLRNEYGIRTFGYTSLIIDPPDGRQPAVTPAEQARRKAQPERGTFSNVVLAGFDDFSLYDRCISRGVPGSVTPVLYGNGVRFVQSPTEVVMTYEMIHESRVIHLGNPAPRPPAHSSWTGFSVGRWDGDTLVVETKGFNARTATSPNLTLTEWFTRVDPDMVEYKYRIDDPTVYTAPYTVRMMLTTQPNYFVMEYSCHEGTRQSRWVSKASAPTNARWRRPKPRDSRSPSACRATWTSTPGAPPDRFARLVSRPSSCVSASLADESWPPQLHRRPAPPHRRRDLSPPVLPCRGAGRPTRRRNSSYYCRCAATPFHRSTLVR